MIEMTNGLASAADPKRRVLRPGDTAELDPAYEARLVAGGFARYLAEPAPQNVPDSGENGPKMAQNAPETGRNVPETGRNVPETSEFGRESAESAPCGDDIAPDGLDEEPVPGPGDAEAAAPGIPGRDELAAMRRPQLEALASEWGVPCRVGATNASIVEALAALAAEQPPELDALGAGE